MKLGKASTETIVLEFFLGTLININRLLNYHQLIFREASSSNRKRKTGIKMVQIRKCIEGYDLNGHEIVVSIYLDK